jgi:hypothetical protein
VSDAAAVRRPHASKPNTLFWQNRSSEFPGYFPYETICDGSHSAADVTDRSDLLVTGYCNVEEAMKKKTAIRNLELALIELHYASADLKHIQTIKNKYIPSSDFDDYLNSSDLEASLSTLLSASSAVQSAIVSFKRRSFNRHDEVSLAE